MHAKIGIVLIFIFTLFIVSPTIISVVEKNFDVSVLFNMSEEENNQKEISKTFDLKISEPKNNLSFFNSLESTIKFEYYSRKYKSISKENCSPPPEIV